MEAKPSQTEVKSVSGLKPFDRNQYTVKKVADYEKAYTLTHEGETWALAEVKGKKLVSLSPTAVYAELNVVEAQEGYKPHAIPLDELMSTRLDSFNENGFLINVLAANGKTRLVVIPDELRVDLEKNQKTTDAIEFGRKPKNLRPNLSHLQPNCSYFAEGHLPAPKLLLPLQSQNVKRTTVNPEKKASG